MNFLAIGSTTLPTAIVTQNIITLAGTQNARLSHERLFTARSKSRNRRSATLIPVLTVAIRNVLSFFMIQFLNTYRGRLRHHLPFLCETACAMLLHS